MPALIDLVKTSEYGNFIEKKFQSLLSKVPSDKTEFSFSISDEELEQAIQKYEGVFSESAKQHFADRLENLSKEWMTTLSSEPLRLESGSVFILDQNQHLDRIYKRLSWQSELPEQSVALFNNIALKRPMNFILLCSAARFIYNANISHDSHITHQIRACDNSANDKNLRYTSPIQVTPISAPN